MNRRDLLEMTLWYIYETSTAEERNIWIWDNASEDDTSDFLGTMVGWPGVRVFRSRENLGLAEPRRRMLPRVQTPYIHTLDDDVWIINRGWASASVRALEADPSIHQLMLQGYPDERAQAVNDYGVGHVRLDQPFFRVPPIQPQLSKIEGGRGVDLSPGMRVEDAGGEKIVVPANGAQLPCAISGSCSAWRTSDVISLPLVKERHPVVDLREAWGFPLQRQRLAEQRASREATLLGYGMFHPCPGPLWHLGRGERHWQTRCDMAEAIYGRSGEEQRSWLENARAASGWGRALEDPDSVL